MPCGRNGDHALIHLVQRNVARLPKRDQQLPLEWRSDFSPHERVGWEQLQGKSDRTQGLLGQVPIRCRATEFALDDSVEETIQDVFRLFRETQARHRAAAALAA